MFYQMVQKKLLNKQIQHSVDNNGTLQDGMYKQRLVKLHFIRFIRYLKITDQRKSGVPPRAGVT